MEHMIIHSISNKKAANDPNEIPDFAIVLKGDFQEDKMASKQDDISRRGISTSQIPMMIAIFWNVRGLNRSSIQAELQDE